MQAADGGSVYLRLSTLPLDQPEREMDETLRHDIIAGAYWRAKPATGPKKNAKKSANKGAIIYTGALAAEAEAAHDVLSKGNKGIGLMAVTSPDRLYKDWRENGAASHVAGLLSELAPDAELVTVMDGHPATLSWIGSVAGHKVRPLGVDRFGQCGDVRDLYRAYGIDAEAIGAAFKGV
jgi:pyruvate dehydrogenase E1 component